MGNIIRRSSDGPFTTISNIPFNDTRLSLEAVGLLTCVLSLPRDWRFNRRWAQKRFNLGRDKLDRIIRELKDGGYVRYVRTRAGAGQWGHGAYFFTAEPSAAMPQEWAPGMPYAHYLLSPHWLDLRRKKLDQAGNKCQVCNAEQSLNVHHRTYERVGHEAMEDLTVLCRPCHDLFHDHSRLFVEEAS